MNFFALSFLTISIVIFIATIIIAFIKREEIKYALKIFLIGIIITNFIMLSSLFYFGNVYTKSGIIYDKSEDLPFILLHNSEYEISTENKAFFSVVYALINTPKMGTLGLKYPVIFAAAYDFPWGLGKPYGFFMLLLSILTPIISGGFIVSYIKSLWNYLAYYLYKRFKNVYYFSDLNEKSMLMAEDIVAQEKHKALIVFCNCNKVSGVFEERIDKNHFIVLCENEQDLVLRFSFGNKKQYFFEISDDDNLNFEKTKKLIEVFDKTKKKYSPDDVKVFLFMNSPLFGSEQLFKSRQEKISIYLIDDVKTSIYNLLFEKPLCDKVDINNQSQSIAVFGSGVYAKEFFKNAIWASVLDENYKTEISYIDAKADEFKKNLKLNCPGIFSSNDSKSSKQTTEKSVSSSNESETSDSSSIECSEFFRNYSLNFYNNNLQSSELNETLNLQNPNYIVVDTGNDEESANLAIYLRMFYLRKSMIFKKTSQANFKLLKPFIAVRIKDSKTAERINNLKDKDGVSYELYSFGFDKEIYSHNLIIESSIDKLAMNCYAAYNKSKLKYKPRDAALFGCNSSNFEQCSNRAATIHIKNKLFRMGLKLKPIDSEPSEDEIKQNDDALKTLQKKLSNSAEIESLQKLEKYRWNAFHFVYGWVSPTLADSKIYSEYITNGSHKYILAKMHACLCEWDNMEKLEKAYNDEPFRSYDKVFIEEIPSIIGCVKNDPRNVAGAKFLLIERK